MGIEMDENIEIFCCYARGDRNLLLELVKHLRALQRIFPITIWHDQHINPGKEWENEIWIHLNKAHVILLLVSPDFMASDYCYSKELQRAMERHERGVVRVIPIILRPVYWQETPFAKLQVLPIEGKPILSSIWHSQDEAFLQVIEGIRKAIEELRQTLQKQVKYDPEQEKRPYDRPFDRTSLRTPPLDLIPHGRITPEADDEIISLPAFLKRGQTRSDPADQAKNIVRSPLFTYQRHTRRVRGLAWSPDGKHIVSGGDEKHIHIWNINTGEYHTLYNKRSQADMRTALAWSPDGTHIVSASNNGIIEIWNAITRRVRYTFSHHVPYSVNAVAWSPGGTYLASAGETLRIWKTSTGKCIAEYPEEFFFGILDRFGGGIATMSWSPDGTRIALGSLGQGNILVIDVSTTEKIFNKYTNSRDLHALIWSPDSTMIAFGGLFTNVTIWSANTGKTVLTCSDNNDALFSSMISHDVYSLAWAPDGRFIASGQTEKDNALVRIWSASTGKSLCTYDGHSDATAIQAVAWSPNGTQIASAGDDMIVQIWQAPRLLSQIQRHSK